MSIFEAVKQSVTTRQAAERYGLRVERNGMCRCPFHQDSTPSMKLDRRYYCFGCGATGDVIDFVSRLRVIGSKEAAILLAQDFAIPYEDSADKPCKPQKQNTDEQNYQHMERHCFRVLLDYYRLLCRWKEDYAPQTPEDGYDPRFVEALQKLSLVEYLLDELLCGDIVLLFATLCLPDMAQQICSLSIFSFVIRIQFIGYFSNAAMFPN